MVFPIYNFGELEELCQLVISYMYMYFISSLIYLKILAIQNCLIANLIFTYHCLRELVIPNTNVY